VDQLADNPFFVLELPPTATPMEIERQGRMILARLELGLPSARTHPSPLGPRPRSADDVRRAMQALADPHRRLAAEPFALAASVATPVTEADSDTARRTDAAADDVGAVVAIDTLVWWRP
jgi:hypothetical protein